MTTDYKILQNQIPSIGDFQRLQEEFELKKMQALQQTTGQDPASVKLANEIQKARAAGDTQRLNDLQMSAKLLDRGVVYDQMNNPMQMPGYGDAVGSIAGTKKSYEAQAQNASDLAYDPLIAGGEAQAKFEQQLGYSPKIARAEKSAVLEAERLGTRQSEFDTGSKTLPIIEELKSFNEKSPSIPFAGATQGIRRLVPGTSEAESAVDLMRQARIDLAAPLAKQLGVNPTDKDFQASLDRIFDIDASRESRKKQIEALEKRIKDRQKQLMPRQTTNPAINTPYDQIQPDIVEEYGGALTPDKQKRLQELRAKRDAGTLK